MKNRTMKGRVLRSYTVSTFSIALVLFLLGSIGYAMSSLFGATEGVREGVVMLVELEDLEQAERDTLATKILQNEVVASLDFVSKQEKIEDEDFRRAFEVDIDKVLENNPLPDSFDVTLAAEAADSTALATFIDATSKLDGVTHISYPEELLEQVHRVVDMMQILLLLFGGAMFVVSLILLANTLRLAIFSHREAINTMKLVGATKWFIMQPFLGRAALQGLIAGVVATILFLCALFGLDNSLPELGVIAQMEIVAITSAVMIVTGVIVALLFTWVIVNKFVNMKSNSIYLY